MHVYVLARICQYIHVYCMYARINFANAKQPWRHRDRDGTVTVQKYGQIYCRKYIQLYGQIHCQNYVHVLIDVYCMYFKGYAYIYWDILTSIPPITLSVYASKNWKYMHILLQSRQYTALRKAYTYIYVHIRDCTYRILQCSIWYWFRCISAVYVCIYDKYTFI